MSRTLTLIIEFLLVTGICFAIGIYLAKRLDQKKKAARRSNLHPHSLPMSAFSTLDHPAARPSGDSTPIDEAEIFMVYGKKAKAQEILKEALARKKITREEYDAFKARHNIE